MFSWGNNKLFVKDPGIGGGGGNPGNGGGGGGKPDIPDGVRALSSLKTFCWTTISATFELTFL